MRRRLVEKAKKILEKEQGTIIKSHAGKLRIALGYPNTYHIGMSNVGFQAVYRFWNEIKEKYPEKTKNFVADWDQGWAGIGVLFK